MSSVILCAPSVLRSRVSRGVQSYRLQGLPLRLAEPCHGSQAWLTFKTYSNCRGL